MEERGVVSLFDYLGYAAGPKLGGQVYKVANILKEKVDTRFVDTRTYKGKDMLYRRAFLDEYFKKEKSRITVVKIHKILVK